jgi:uncharacterized membrane protein YfcA
MNWYWAYISLGLFTGFSAGLLGRGGGLVMAPTLTFIYASQAGFPQDEVLHMALGTSMATILFTALASLHAHHRHQAVIWKVVIQITPGILFGTLLGTFFAAQISSKLLGLIFTGFTCFVALQLTLNFKPKPSRKIPGRTGVFTVGTLIGIISSLVSVGGAAITVPFLTWCNVRVHQAIGTSAAIGFPIAIGGTLGYIFNGWGHADLPAWSLGFVYLPALLWMVPVSMLAAPIGAKFAHSLSVVLLKRVFAGLIIAMAARMLWTLFS